MLAEYEDKGRSDPALCALDQTMIGYLNMGLPEDAVVRNPLKVIPVEFGDPKEFTYGALRNTMIAYEPD